MPLMHSDSPAAFSHNVAAEMEAGKPQAQAVAIAYREARGATLRKVAKAARVHHKIDLSNVMLDSWPAALDEGGAPELAEQVRNVLARGPARKKGRSSVEGESQPKKARRKYSASKEEREARRRADRRTAEDAAETARTKLRACESSIAHYEKTIENSRSEIKKLRADCKKHKAEAKKQEAKARRLG